MSLRSEIVFIFSLTQNVIYKSLLLNLEVFPIFIHSSSFINKYPKNKWFYKNFIKLHCLLTFVIVIVSFLYSCNSLQNMYVNRHKIGRTVSDVINWLTQGHKSECCHHPQSNIPISNVNNLHWIIRTAQ